MARTGRHGKGDALSWRQDKRRRQQVDGGPARGLTCARLEGLNVAHAHARVLGEFLLGQAGRFAVLPEQVAKRGGHGHILPVLWPVRPWCAPGLLTPLASVQGIGTLQITMLCRAVPRVVQMAPRTIAGETAGETAGFAWSRPPTTRRIKEQCAIATIAA